MKSTATTGKQSITLFVILAAVILIYCCFAWRVFTLAENGTDNNPAWANPTAMVIKQVSPVATAQSQPNYLENLDCSLVTYRLAGTSTMQDGCFTETAFGLMDADSNIVLFNGTDEGLPLLPYTAHQVLEPWPKALNMVSLSAANTGGSYISLYKNPIAAVEDHRDLLLRLTAKQFVKPPDLVLKDRLGQPLVINPQTMAFSDGGAWLVAETLSGSFIRMNLATLDIKAFAPSFGSQGSQALLKSRVAITDNGHYVAIANDAAESFRVYDLTACSGGGNNLQPEDCSSYDYLPFINHQIPSLKTVRHVRFVNDSLISFEANSLNSSSSGLYELAPRASIGALIDYMGLGDSYTSGEGAYDYLSGTERGDNVCHLSIHSYPLLLTRDLFSVRGGHSVACSGAVIHDIGSNALSYRGQVKDVADFEHLQSSQPQLLASVMVNFLPGYIAQHRFVKQYQPSITTVSVGGNDIGFADILERCVIPHVSIHLSDSNCFNTYEDRLEVVNLAERTVPRWTRLYNQLKAEAPESRLYAIGYPGIVSDTGNCSLNTHLGKSELEFAQELIIYLNSAIQKAASHAGIVYVDISQALAGHRLCETASSNVAVNGLTAGNDIGLLGLKAFGKESYHPNAFGQELIEQAILRQTHNLTSVLPAPEPIISKEKILKAPSSGRKVATRSPSSTITSKIVKKAKPVTIKVSGIAHGLKPKSVYQIRLDGPTGVVVGTTTSDEEGNIDTTVTIPGNTPSGGHTVDVTGENEAGQDSDVTQPVYVPESDNDSDGDGIPDTTDSCPAAANSGQDVDLDGNDDSCDGFISTPPSTNPTSSTTSSNSVTTNPINTLPGSSSTVQKLVLPSVTKVTRLPVKTKTTGVSPATKKAITGRSSTARSAHPTPAKRLHLHVNWWHWLLWALLIWLLLIMVGVWLDHYLERRRTKYLLKGEGFGYN